MSLKRETVRNEHPESDAFFAERDRGKEREGERGGAAILLFLNPYDPSVINLLLVSGNEKCPHE